MHASRPPTRSLHARDDRGSLPMAILVTILAAALGALMLPILLNQAQSTRFAATRVRALDAAQAGIDVVVGRIRASTSTDSDNKTWGTVSALPCLTRSNPATGKVNSADVASYSVWLTYYTANPASGASPMLCTSGYGTYDTGTTAATPRYALIHSTGTDGPATNGATQGRTIVTTYSFQTDDTNIPGGPIQIYPNSDTDSCLDAGTATPALNSTLTLQTCSATTPVIASQRFAYRPDLTLQLLSSINEVSGGITYKQGLCLDISSTTTNSSTGVSSPVSSSDTVANPVIFKPCGNSDGSTVWSQQWSFDDHSAFQATQSDSASTGSLSGLCMGAASANHAMTPAIQIMGCKSSINDPQTSWLPDPAVGAGNAVSDPSVTDQSVQWINFQQFGRCINDPGSQPQIDFIIVASCKQNPKRASVARNQFLTYNSTTHQMVMTLPSPYTGASTNYCLYSQSSAGSTASQLALLTECSSHTGVNSTALTWTHPTPQSSPSTANNRQYGLIDANGQCMSVAKVKVADDTRPYLGTDGNGTAVYANSDYSRWSKLVTEPCDGTTKQQWNAASTLLNASYQNTREESPGGN